MTGIMLALIGSGFDTSVVYYVNISPSLVQVMGNETGNVTATPDGGTSPYTYQWVQVISNTSCPIQIESPTSSITKFKALATLTTASYWGAFTCLVTDSNGVHGLPLTAIVYFYGTH